MSIRRKIVIQLSYNEMLEALNEYTIKKYGFRATHSVIQCSNNRVHKIEMIWDGQNDFGYKTGGDERGK